MLVFQKSSTPVVLAGAMHHAGLAIARSLGSLGVRVFAIEADPWAPVAVSRYCVGRYTWDLKKSGTAESLDFLSTIASQFDDRPLLLPTNDFAALFVVDHAAELSRSYLFPGQIASTSHALVRKRSMFDMAVRLGIPTPITCAPQSNEDVLQFLETAEFPVVLKADDGARPWSPAHPDAKTKYIVRGRQELFDQYRRMQDRDVPNVVFQEYIPGGEDSIWMFNGYFNARSECLFGMTAQKLRQCPAYTGASSLAVCRHNQQVYDLTLRFMQNVGYRGILDIGFRYDARDGLYKVLDVNPRIGSTFRAFVRPDGLDVARALYLDLTGQPIPQSPSIADGRKWIVEDYDLVSSIRYLRDGKIRMSDWIGSFQGVEEYSFLSLRDPLPMFPMLASDALELSRRVRSLFFRTCSATQPTDVAISQDGRSSMWRET